MVVLPVVPKWLPAMPSPFATPLITPAPPAAPDRPAPASVPRKRQATSDPCRNRDVVVRRRRRARTPPVAVVPPPRPSHGDRSRFSLGIGAIAMACRLLPGWWHAARLAAQSQPIDDGLYESRFVAAPVAIGVFRPRIVLPSAWTSWPADELRTVRIHEDEHIRRRDGLTSLVAGLNTSLFWFHPLAWWLDRWIAIAAEEACDDAVIRASGEPRRYAETLLRMADAVRARGARVEWQGVGMAGASLAARIDRVLRGRAARTTSLLTRAILAVVCAGAIVPGVACSQTPPALRREPRAGRAIQEGPGTS